MQQGVLLMLSAFLALICVTTVSAGTDLCEQFPELAGCKIEGNMQKRKSAYMRFGKRSAADDLANEPFREYEKRKSAYMRFGKRSNDVSLEDQDQDQFNMIKRKSAYMRFGKRAAMDFEPERGFEMEKRKSAYMRFGKRSVGDEFENMEKRKVAALRFG